MALTYVNIASTTLGSNQQAITFSGISSSYTDLVIRFSARANNPSDIAMTVRLQLNGSTGTTSSITRFQGDGSTSNSQRNSNTQFTIYSFAANAGTSTANTFSNAEIYIPSYTAAINKPILGVSAMENNGAEAYLTQTAALWRETSAINSIKIELQNTAWSFLTGSTFYLYGIKNA